MSLQSDRLNQSNKLCFNSRSQTLNQSVTQYNAARKAKELKLLNGHVAYNLKRVTWQVTEYCNQVNDNRVGQWKLNVELSGKSKCKNAHPINSVFKKQHS